MKPHSSKSIDRFELWVLDLSFIVSDFIFNSYLECGSVLENIFKLCFVNRHSLLIGVVKLGAIQSIAIFCVEVFLLAQLSKPLLYGLVGHFIKNISGNTVS
jgi:hypothetical protein